MRIQDVLQEFKEWRLAHPKKRGEVLLAIVITENNDWILTGEFPNKSIKSVAEVREFLADLN